MSSIQVDFPSGGYVSKHQGSIRVSGGEMIVPAKPRLPPNNLMSLAEEIWSNKKS